MSYVHGFLLTDYWAEYYKLAILLELCSRLVMASVLIIEDSMLELYRYVNFLKELKYDVTGISSVNEARIVLAKRSFDYIITDLHLSTSSETPEGFEILKFSKELNPNVITIALSFDPKKEVAEKVLQLGAALFVKKPLASAEELEVFISQAKKNSDLKKQNSLLNKEKEESGSVLQSYPYGMVVSDSQVKLTQKTSSKS